MHDRFEPPKNQCKEAVKGLYELSDQPRRKPPPPKTRKYFIVKKTKSKKK